MANEAIHNHPNDKEQEVEAIQAREQRIERMEQTLKRRTRKTDIGHIKLFLVKSLLLDAFWQIIHTRLMLDHIKMEDMIKL
ncbi:hypothetical protein CDL15_Pgr004673 [Punica granatum]|uniref:Uncharacterized protein n=1 Tax=Punica granatum TaxID=22663 RepID=A0A218VXD2_PUNGR|nr:hypothetical protein CDL15_Pgr004673 [Punica granatum]